jgi:hypothetical protein
MAALVKFRDQGILTEAEFQTRKMSLLDKAFGKVGTDKPQQTVTLTIPQAAPKQSSAIPTNINFGDYHALVIGINNYKARSPRRSVGANNSD